MWSESKYTQPLCSQTTSKTAGAILQEPTRTHQEVTASVRVSGASKAADVGAKKGGLGTH